MSQPVLRYESKHHEVTDGALFALVEATDPEAFLVLEARPESGAVPWHYALARMTSLWLAAPYQGEQGWEADALLWNQLPAAPTSPTCCSRSGRSFALPTLF